VFQLVQGVGKEQNFVRPGVILVPAGMAVDAAVCASGGQVNGRRSCQAGEGPMG